jgi:hypothetical protein
VALSNSCVAEGGTMADESLIREALAEAERHRRQRERRARMVHWSDLERELAREMLARLAKANGLDDE